VTTSVFSMAIALLIASCGAFGAAAQNKSGLLTGALFGLTDASADAQFRLWVTRDF
jgi:hypothetical protein